MKSLRHNTNTVPSEPRFSLRDAHQHERQETEKHMGFNAVILPMINWSQIQGGLQGTEGSIHLQRLLVPQVFRRQCVVTDGEYVLAVQMRFLQDLVFVDFDASIFELSQISPHCPVRQERTEALLMGFPLLIPQLFEVFFNPGEDLLPRGLIFFGFLRIVNQDNVVEVRRLA